MGRKKKTEREAVVDNDAAKRRESEGGRGAAVMDYEGGKKANLSHPSAPLKGKTGQYPSRDEIHDRVICKGKFDFWRAVDELAAPKPADPEDLNKWVVERNNIDRLARILRLYGISVFGAAGRFDEWMQAEIPALGQVRPCTLLGTVDGIQEIINVLGRIEHGVFS